MTQHREPDPTLVTGASGYVGGRRLGRLGRITGECADGAPAAQELVDQEAADIARGAGDEGRVGFAVLGHRARYVAKHAGDSIRVATLPVEGACRGEETLDIVSKLA